MKKGCFITFEGADGCGKTTQARLIGAYLKDKGFDVLTTREPGGSNLGISLREILLHHEGYVSPKCESFLFLADRAQHVDTIIVPAVQEGKVVLCDRYTDSTIAYQGYGKGENIELIKKLNDMATSGKKPDLTLVFDVDSEVAQTRLGGEKDRMESEGMTFHKNVRQGYLNIAKAEPDRVVIIDANQPIDAVFIAAKKVVEMFLYA